MWLFSLYKSVDGLFMLFYAVEVWVPCEEDETLNTS